MISPFEYIIVLISIILGMGITQIVSGIAQIIQRWDNVKVYWPHTILILLVFVIHIQEWWVIYDMRNYKYWRFPIFLFIILYPVNLYILARILFPLRWRGEVDLKQFYYLSFRRIYLFTITLDVLAVMDNIFIADYRLQDQFVQLTVLSILIIVTLLNTRNQVIHYSIAILLLLITIITFSFTWNTLLITN
jgi:hypothetical protein